MVMRESIHLAVPYPNKFGFYVKSLLQSLGNLFTWYIVAAWILDLQRGIEKKR